MTDKSGMKWSAQQRENIQRSVLTAYKEGKKMGFQKGVVPWNKGIKEFVKENKRASFKENKPR